MALPYTTQNNVERIVEDLLKERAGTKVVANPTLIGTEPSLTGLSVDGSKYKVNTEPTTYLKSATVSGQTLTLTKKDNTTVSFTPAKGTQLYRHTIKVNGDTTVFSIVNKTSTHYSAGEMIASDWQSASLFSAYYMDIVSGVITCCPITNAVYSPADKTTVTYINGTQFKTVEIPYVLTSIEDTVAEL